MQTCERCPHMQAHVMIGPLGIALKNRYSADLEKERIVSVTGKRHHGDARHLSSKELMP